jgi:uncharacterized membrane protein (UPF0182 family)
VRVSRIASLAKDSALVYPGAAGAALVMHGKGVAAPVLGSGFRRLALAWSEQRLDLMWRELPEDTRIARRRDVRERVGTLFPIFAQGSEVIPAYLGDSLVWVLELYSASSTYPLSKHYVLAGAERSYFRHTGTTVTNAASGRVTMVPTTTPDPIAMAWRTRFPSNIRAGAPDLLDELTATPQLPPGSSPAAASPSDAAFRAEVVRLYSSMRAALARGDLKAFGAAYDSLGAVVTR